MALKRGVYVCVEAVKDKGACELGPRVADGDARGRSELDIDPGNPPRLPERTRLLAGNGLLSAELVIAANTEVSDPSRVS